MPWIYNHVCRLQLVNFNTVIIFNLASCMHALLWSTAAKISAIIIIVEGWFNSGFSGLTTLCHTPHRQGLTPTEFSILLTRAAL